MSRLLSESAAEHPEDPALIDDSRLRTWAELDDRVDRLIQTFWSRGLVAGDRLALLSGNRCEFVETALACLQAGLVVVPLNWHCTDTELAYILANSGARGFVVDDRFTALADATLERVTDQPPVHFVMGADAEGERSFEAAIRSSARADDAQQIAGSMMFYTSGTTGQPKGVKGWISEVGTPPESITEVAQGFINLLQIDAEAKTLLSGPVYHTAQFVWTLFPMLKGGTVIMRHRFDAAETLSLIDEHEIVNTHFVPTQFIRLLRLPKSTKERFSGASLRTVLHGSAPCPHNVKREMIQWWGPIITEYYGATEGGTTHVISSAEWLDKPGSVGKTVPIFETIVTDDDGNRLDAGETGALWFRHVAGRDFEYYNDPEKTAAAHLEPGVFTFGDIGWIDDDGYLFLADRKSDMIISGGVNIYPAEIEGVLVDHELVADAAVFGIPDDEYGEQVKAAIELVPGCEPSPELVNELRELCRARLAGFKVPRSFDFEDRLPREASGKLYKRKLREKYWAKAGRAI